MRGNPDADQPPTPPTMPPDDSFFDQADIIHRYTRAQAIKAGILIDVTELAREAGIRYPIALTHTVYEQYVKVPAGVIAQDETGRLWDILFLLHSQIRQSQGGDSLLVAVHVRNDNRRPKKVILKAVCGPDDDMTPCITIMLPEED